MHGEPLWRTLTLSLHFSMRLFFYFQNVFCFLLVCLFSHLYFSFASYKYRFLPDFNLKPRFHWLSLIKKLLLPLVQITYYASGDVAIFGLVKYSSILLL